MTYTLTPDAEAQETFYAAVLRDAEWQMVTNCPHRHRNRETAEKCAETWLRQAMESKK